jgi:DNA-binding IclR family transcriptional regulator
MAPSIAALGAPIFNARGLVMSLTLTGLSGSFDSSFSGEPAQHLLVTAQRISRRAGGSSFFGA